MSPIRKDSRDNQQRKNCSGETIQGLLQNRTCNGSPARATIAFPSPVQVCAEVAEKYARP